MQIDSYQQMIFQMTNLQNISNSASEIHFYRYKHVIVLTFIFVFSLTSLLSLYSNMPPFSEADRKAFMIPTNLNDAKNLGKVLVSYQKSYYYEVLFGFCLFYIFLQTFAIPGSVFLSILSGFLYPFPVALILVCCCSALGATCCYLLSNLAGKRMISFYFPNQIQNLTAKVARHKIHMLNYIIFLRVTPILPNWLINLISPIVEVPLKPYFWGTFLGVAPPSMLAIQMGQTLNTLSSSGTHGLSIKSFAFLTFFGFLSLAPILFKKQLVQKYD